MALKRKTLKRITKGKDMTFKPFFSYESLFSINITGRFQIYIYIYIEQEGKNLSIVF